MLLLCCAVVVSIEDHGGSGSGLQGVTCLPLAPLVRGEAVSGRRRLEGGHSGSRAEVIVDVSYRPYF